VEHLALPMFTLQTLSLSARGWAEQLMTSPTTTPR